MYYNIQQLVFNVVFDCHFQPNQTSSYYMKSVVLNCAKEPGASELVLLKRKLFTDHFDSKN